MALPVDYNTGTVKANYVDLLGVPEVGKVTFIAQAKRMVSDATDTIVIGKPIVVSLTAGAFEIQLPATDDPDIMPTGFTYQVTEQFSNNYLNQYYIEVPADSVTDLSEVVASIEPNPGSTVLPTDIARRSGGNTFTGVQIIEADLPLYTFAEIVDGAEFKIVGYTAQDGVMIRGVIGARLDMSAIGGPVDTSSMGTFAVDPAGNGYIIELSTSMGPGEPPRTSRIVAPDLQIIYGLGGTEAWRMGRWVSGEPLEPDDVATKSYVDTAVGGLDVGSLLTPQAGLQRAVKYGRNLGGRWALVCSPGHFTTPDVGPLDRDGIRVRARLKLLEADYKRSGFSLAYFEFLTQFRNANGYEFDQDNLELALTLYLSRMGFFNEDCRIGTAFPVDGGEYVAGRFYTDTPTSSGLDLTLGDAIELRYDYIFDGGDGRWRKAFYIRTDETSVVLTGPDVYEERTPLSWSPYQDWGANNQDFYWKRVAELVGPEADGVGSIADAGEPFHIGLNGGVLGVEYVQLSHIDSGALGGEQLILDFQSKDIGAVTPGVATSTLVPGQEFTFYNTADNSDVGSLPTVYNDSFYT